MILAMRIIRDAYRVKTDKSDLLFEMKDNKTLIGEGFTKGTFTKINK